VPGATTYRLQWGEARGEETEWMTVYTGATPGCALTAPEGVNIVLRVRAENGTPEDDPDFNRILDILNAPTQTDQLIGYAYTLRVVDQDQAQFIAAPISDANHNDLIDADEVPSDIGESFPMDRQIQYVLNNKVRTIDLCSSNDKWGRWITIAEPLWAPDGAFDGILGVDFNVDRIHQKMFHERIYPLCVFVLVTISYFGTVLSISYFQIKERTISQLADGLRESNTKLTEAQKVTEAALQVKTLFLTNMSHEFRTPLNAMLGFTAILEQHTKQCCAEEQNTCSDAIARVRDNGRILLELVDNILCVASMSENHTARLKIVPVNIRLLITEVADALRSQAENKSLTLTVIDSPDIPEQIGSSLEHLRQVLTLLVGNAIKFTQQGNISIRSGISSEPHMLYIAVSDTGIGIAPEKIETIFKPFSQSDASLTRQYGGTGIGLSVALQSAEVLNGRIAVESQLGQGSTFTFTFPGLPASPPPQEIPKVQEPKEQQAPPPVVSLAECRILYVEDTKVNQIILSKQLERTGATVELAENGQLGIDKIEEAENQGKPFDVILMDMQMPVLDGYEATRQLRSNGYSKPIIAVTAHALAGDREKTLEAGCDDYTTKPVDLARLAEIIHSLWKR
jgi:signal transduction histidine kinase/ActR/RegA family two-component response regulator